MNNELYQLLLSLRLGDGAYVTQRKGYPKTYYIKTNSISHDYLAYKRKIFERNNIVTKDIVCQSGYNKLSDIKGFTTLTIAEATLVGNMSIDDIIEDLTIEGLVYYYLDDGSLHKRKHFMNLYCNSFTIDETNHLIDKLHELFPQKRCTLCYDRKKDGRVFPYVYVPCSVAKSFNVFVRKFLLDNNIDSLLYKTFSPSQTIENIGQTVSRRKRLF